MAEDSELELLRESVRRLVERKRPAIWNSAGATGRCDPDVWAAVRDSGLLLAGLDPAHGGFDRGLAAAAVVLEETGRGLFDAPVLANMIGLQLLQRAADRSARAAACLASVIEGSERLAFGWSEPGARFGRTGTTIHHVDGDRIRLSGCKTVVIGGGDADTLIVASRSAEGTPALLLVPAATAGVECDGYALVDNQGGADIRFDDVDLPLDCLIVEGAEAQAILDDGLDFAALAATSQALGAMQALFDLTLDHVKQRVQFGRPIGANQVVQHRLVDLLRMIAETRVATGAAFAALAAGTADRSLAVATARVLGCRAARKVGQDAVQFHGAIGTTDESVVSHYFRKLICLSTIFGDAGHHRDRFAALDDGELGGAAGPLSEAEATFCEEIRAFVEAELSPETRAITAAGGTPPQALRLEWEQALGRKGWFAYSWPEAEGGPGFSVVEQFLFETITAEMNAPRLPLFGIKMAGPILNAFGTAEQKARHLPGIMAGTTSWCQGYSEPGAGSDLASLQTRADRHGDHYVVNGQKIWTTAAQHADWIFMLVRTSREERRQDGITFLLADMRSSGITVRPIISADGHHGFNEVFFQDVEVPVENRVGEEGRGWSIAKYLLSHERLGVLGSLALRQAMGRAVRSAGRLDAAGRPFGDHPALKARLTMLKIRMRALDAWIARLLADIRETGSVGQDVSMAMIAATLLGQDIAEFNMEMLGEDALPFSFADSRAPERRFGPAEDFTRTATANYIYQRVFTILGGTTEIQKNIIAKSILGLPS